MSTKALVAILVGLALVGGSIYAWVLSSSVKKLDEAKLLEERTLCRSHFQEIANALLAHRVRTSKWAKSLDDLKEDLVGGAPICPTGGKYTFTTQEIPLSFTVHCTVQAHDKGTGSEPSGYSPGQNSS